MIFSLTVFVLMVFLRLFKLQLIHSHKRNNMRDKLSHTYSVQLLYKTPPHIDGNKLLNELCKHCGSVDRLGDKDNFYLYAFPEYAIQYKDAKVPPQIFLAFPDIGKNEINLEDALQQSWSWPEARKIASACPIHLLLTDMMASGLDQKARLDLFHCALKSVLTVAPCKAIHWGTSQQLVNPLVFLDSRKLGDFNPLQFAINVRFYNIANSQKGEMLMDTMGLAVFGLPDLQCHFIGLEPNEVARVLFNSACYIFDKSDIIDDGNTIQGIKPTDKWKCQHEDALIGPHRVVLDLNPGKPYAAGNRK